MILLLEVLSHMSSKNKGLAFAATINDFTTWQIFSTQYFPTILSVSFSMLWNWIDLDVKRLEPWFQMSTPYGARADDSVFLEYTSDFAAFVPLRAARRRYTPMSLL